MHWPELYAKLQEHVVLLNCFANCMGYQWSNVSTTSSQFWLTRRGRAEVRHIWHLSLLTMCHLVHWDRRTNCCLAVFTRPSSWQSRHSLLVCQRSGMTCLLTVVLQLVSIVLNAILNNNYFTTHTLITPSDSCLSRLRFHFFVWTDWCLTNWFWLIDWSPGHKQDRRSTASCSMLCLMLTKFVIVSLTASKWDLFFIKPGVKVSGISYILTILTNVK